MRYQRPKGTADILPGQSETWHFVEETARLLFGDYRYNEIRTPMFESFDVFARSAGDTSDVVTKEMYDFHDKGDRHVALRPEGTAGVVRAYVENKLYGPEFAKPYKAFYIGPMFRYERPQSGRQRQFHQVGVEAFGSDSPALDVEVIAMAINYFETLGLSGLRVAINSLGDAESRANYRQALIDYLKPHYDELSADSKERLEKNPLRVLDSKDPQDQKFVADAPSILDYLTDDAQAHFDEVKALMTELNIEFEIDAAMVRGLDYYNHTIFEIMFDSKESGKGLTVCGGGRYSGLVKEFGGPQESGIGFGLGLERLIMLLEAEGVQIPVANDLDVYVVGIGDGTSHETLKLVQAIRGFGFSADRDFLDRKPKAQFKSADREHASFVMTIGQDELENGTVNFKSMKSGNEVSVSLTEVYENFPQIYDQNFEE